jgi:hypothetical protein
MKLPSFLSPRTVTAKPARRPSSRLLLESLEDRVVPSLANGTILVCSGPSSYATQPQSSFPIGIIGVNPTTQAQFPVSIDSSQDGSLFTLPTYVTEGADGQLYVTDLQAFGSGAIIRVDPNTGQQFLVSEGGLLNGPNCLAWVNGELYVANEADASGTVHSIVQVDPHTGTQTLITDGSNGGFSVPTGMVPGPGNTVYVLDEPGNYNGSEPGGVWQVSLTTGQETLITWGNMIDHPVDMTQDVNGNLIVIGNAVADPSTQRARIVRVNPAIHSAQGFNQSLVYTELLGYPLDGITENSNNGMIYTGSISYGTNPAGLFAINPAAQMQSTVTMGGQLSLVEGIGVYHAVVQTTATATAVFSSAKLAVSGQTVTFTAIITPQNSGSVSPTGTVQFQIDGSNVGGLVNVTSAGGLSTATLQIARLAVGTHVVTASYSGDVNFDGSHGTLSGGEMVSKAGTHTVVTSSVNPSLLGQVANFLAEVTINAPGSATVATPTGLVVFYDNGTSIGQGILRTSGGMTTASFSTNSLTVGRHQITAAYTAGDANFNASPVSAALTQTVQQASSSGGGSGGPHPITPPFGFFAANQDQANPAGLAPQATSVAANPNSTLSSTQPDQLSSSSASEQAGQGETSTNSGSAQTDSSNALTGAIDSLFAGQANQPTAN